MNDVDIAATAPEVMEYLQKFGMQPVTQRTATSYNVQMSPQYHLPTTDHRHVNPLPQIDSLLTGFIGSTDTIENGEKCLGENSGSNSGLTAVHAPLTFTADKCSNAYLKAYNPTSQNNAQNGESHSTHSFSSQFNEPEFEVANGNHTQTIASSLFQFSSEGLQCPDTNVQEETLRPAVHSGNLHPRTTNWNVPRNALQTNYVHPMGSQHHNFTHIPDWNNIVPQSQFIPFSNPNERGSEWINNQDSTNQIPQLHPYQNPSTSCTLGQFGFEQQTGCTTVSNALPNIGVFFNRQAVSEPNCATPATLPSPTFKSKQEELSFKGSGFLSNIIHEKRQMKIDIPTPSISQHWTKSNEQNIITSDSPSSVPIVNNPGETSVSSGNRSDSLHNTPQISIRKLPNQDDNSRTTSLGFQFPSSTDIGPILELHKLTNSLQPKKPKSKRSTVSWLSDDVFDEVLEDIGEWAPSGKKVRKRSSKGKDQQRQPPSKRPALQAITNNRNVRYNYLSMPSSCKPCKVMLKDIRFLLPKKTRKRSYPEVEPNYHTENSERPPIKLKIYRCKPCKVVLQDIWPWLMGMKQVQDKESENQYTGECSSSMETESSEETILNTPNSNGACDNTKTREKLLAYICKKCNISFPTAEECASHLQTVHNKSYFKCSTCLRQFPTHEQFQIHVQTVCPPLKSTKQDAQPRVPHPKVRPEKPPNVAERGATPTRSLFETFLKEFQHHRNDSKWDFSGLKQNRSIRQGIPVDKNQNTIDLTTKDLYQNERNRLGESIVSPEHDGFPDTKCPQGSSRSAAGFNQVDTQNCLEIGNTTRNSCVKFPLENSNENSEPLKSVKVAQFTQILSDYKDGKKLVQNQFKYNNRNATQKDSALITFNSAVDKLILNSPAKMGTSDESEIRASDSTIKIEQKLEDNNEFAKQAVPMYICKKCNLYFQDVQDCSKHLKTMHNKASLFKCTSCKKRFPVEQEFLNHIQGICLPKDGETGL